MVPERPLYPENACLLAPVAGYTDLPFRLSARRHGNKYAFTEMVDAGSLVFGVKKSLRLLARDPSEAFLGVQIVGSDPETLKKSVEILNKMDFSVIDFNLGCPAPKVAKKCEGAALARKKPEEALKAFSVIAETARSPVSVKMRILSETDPEPTVQLVRRLADCGASAVTVHGRIAEKFYSGPVFFDIIRAAAESVKIPVIANGGALSAPLYHELRENSSCSRAMVARGALGNPWIFSEIDGGLPPTLEEFGNEVREHFFSMRDFYGEPFVFPICRKTLLAYLRGRGFPGSLRASVSFLNTLEDFELFMKEIGKGPLSKVYQETGRVARC